MEKYTQRIQAEIGADFIKGTQEAFSSPKERWNKVSALLLECSVAMFVLPWFFQIYKEVVSWSAQS